MAQVKRRNTAAQLDSIDKTITKKKWLFPMKKEASSQALKREAHVCDTGTKFIGRVRPLELIHRVQVFPWNFKPLSSSHSLAFMPLSRKSQSSLLHTDVLLIGALLGVSMCCRRVDANQGRKWRRCEKRSLIICPIFLIVFVFPRYFPLS